MSIFTANNKRNLKRNNFDFSHERKLSTVFGKLTPVLCEEVLPGDSFKVDTEIMARMAPMLAPVMHRINIFTHFFYVPNRIIWDEWEDFETGGELLDKNPVLPYLKYNDAFKNFFSSGSLADHLGFPSFNRLTAAPTVTGEQNLNALPFKAYQSIYNEWYRDQDLQQPFDIGKTTSGDNSTITNNLANIRLRAWEKDYFTSARPNAQKGEPVNWSNQDVKGHDLTLRRSGTQDVVPSDTMQSNASGTIQSVGGGFNVYLEGIQGSIAELRKAEAMQSYVERLQRSGNRYREHLASIWGVISSDARIDIPEFLGGGKTPCVISEVLQTAPDNATTPNSTQGEMFGHGVSVGRNHGFSRTFQEHGFVIGILSILPRSGYSEGLNRMWTRSDRFDYPVPDLALIGEQELVNRELWFDTANPTTPKLAETFGYQQRYAEWKQKLDTVHGDFRYALNYWHLNRQILASVNLDQNFIECDNTQEGLTRIFNVIDPNQDSFWIQLYHKMDVIRGLPYQAIPDLT